MSGHGNFTDVSSTTNDTPTQTKTIKPTGINTHTPGVCDAVVVPIVVPTTPVVPTVDRPVRFVC